MWSCKVYITDVKQQLQRAGIPFEQHDYVNESEYLKAHFRQPKLKESRNEQVSTLRITGGQEKAPVWLEFQPGAEGMALYDLYFGEYACELFQNTDEVILQLLVETIQEMMSGKAYVIASWNVRSFAWNGDAYYYVAPGEDEDESVAFEKALRKLKRPRGWLASRLGVKTIYAIYNWNSYREIVR